MNRSDAISSEMETVAIIYATIYSRTMYILSICVQLRRH